MFIKSANCEPRRRASYSVARSIIPVHLGTTLNIVVAPFCDENANLSFTLSARQHQLMLASAGKLVLHNVRTSAVKFL